MSDDSENTPPPKPIRGYEVGYGKPPVGRQYPKGKSGNPGGRPKGALSLSKSMTKALNRKVRLKVNGREREMTILEAAALQLARDVANGNIKSLSWVNVFLAAEEAKLPPVPDYIIKFIKEE